MREQSESLEGTEDADRGLFDNSDTYIKNLLEPDQATQSQQARECSTILDRGEPPSSFRRVEPAMRADVT